MTFWQWAGAVAIGAVGLLVAAILVGACFMDFWKEWNREPR